MEATGKQKKSLSLLETWLDLLYSKMRERGRGRMMQDIFTMSPLVTRKATVLSRMLAGHFMVSMPTDFSSL